MRRDMGRWLRLLEFPCAASLASSSVCSFGASQGGQDPMNLKVKNIFSSTCPVITCFDSCEVVDFVDDTILFSMQFFGAIMNKVQDMLARMRVLIIKGLNNGLAV